MLRLIVACLNEQIRIYDGRILSSQLATMAKREPVLCFF
jgi:hypothetical protein